MIKYNTIIIGGGLAGLTCTIRLAEEGQRCAVVSTGQNALSCSSGTLNLLGSLPDGTPVENPLDAIDRLPDNHPYAVMGATYCHKAADEAKALLERAGIRTVGSAVTNHKRFTPIGGLRDCWLSPEEQTVELHEGRLPWHKVAVVSFVGFMDFNTSFMVSGLQKLGTECKVVKVVLPAIAALRRSASEMRATNIARVFEQDENISSLAAILNSNSEDCDTILLPAVFGLKDNSTLDRMKAAVRKPICLLPTLPPSVPGTRLSEMLVSRLRALGGTFMPGDTVLRADFADNRIERIYTANHADIALQARNYVLCSGDFFSRGLIALSDKVVEPALGLDVDFSGDSTSWSNPDAFGAQPYQRFGIFFDQQLHALRGGKAVENLYGAGAILASFDALKEGCGAGEAMLTALYVASNILNQQAK